MHDIKAIRDNPQAFDAGLGRRGLAALSPALIEIDQQKRAVQNSLQEMLNKRNGLSKEVGEAMKKGEKDRAEAIKAEVAALKDAIAKGEDEERQLTAKLNEMLAAIPNIPLDEVPDGVDEHGNVEVRRWGTPPGHNFEPRQHFDVGENAEDDGLRNRRQNFRRTLRCHQGSACQARTRTGAIHARYPKPKRTATPSIMCR